MQMPLSKHTHRPQHYHRLKLGGDELVDAGAKSLTDLATEIDTTRMKTPAFRMVLTGVGDFPCQKDYGVIVVPIGYLKAKLITLSSAFSLSLATLPFSA